MTENENLQRKSIGERRCVFQDRRVCIYFYCVCSRGGGAVINDDDFPVGVVIALVVIALSVVAFGFGVWALAS